MASADISIYIGVDFALWADFSFGQCIFMKSMTRLTAIPPYIGIDFALAAKFLFGTPKKCQFNRHIIHVLNTHPVCVFNTHPMYLFNRHPPCLFNTLHACPLNRHVPAHSINALALATIPVNPVKRHGTLDNRALPLPCFKTTPTTFFMPRHNTPRPQKARAGCSACNETVVYVVLKNLPTNPFRGSIPHARQRQACGLIVAHAGGV